MSELTVFKGFLEVDTGLLTITHAMFEKTQVEYYGTYGVDNANLFYFDTNVDLKKYNNNTVTSNNKPISNIYRAIDVSSGAYMKDCCMRTGSNSPYRAIYFRDDRFEDLTAANAYFANNTLHVLAKLLDDIVYQLSPTAIKTLLNTNNIFADTGDILDGEYWSKNPLTVTRAMLNTLRDAGEVTEITEPEEPEESDER